MPPGATAPDLPNDSAMRDRGSPLDRLAGRRTDHQAHQVVAQAMGDLGNDVARGGSDEHEVGPLGQTDVLRIGGVDQVERAGPYLAAGQRLERQWRDKLLSLGGHADGDAGAMLHELADDIRNLVRRDATADEDDDIGTAYGDDVAPFEPKPGVDHDRRGARWCVVQRGVLDGRMRRRYAD